jgi:hypothetical protein
MFVLALVQLYRSKHGGGKGAGGSSGSNKTGGSRGGGMLGGMGEMGKSNVQVFGVDKKIKTRFKHVAGME